MSENLAPSPPFAHKMGSHRLLPGLEGPVGAHLMSEKNYSD